MVVCNLETFQQHYLPFNPGHHDVNSALSRLRPKHLNHSGSKDTWRVLDSPSNSTLVESDTFVPLAVVFQALEEYKFATVTGRTCKYRFKLHGGSTPNSRIPGSTQKIDGSFMSGNRPVLRISDIAVAAEFKKVDQDIQMYDVSTQLVP